MPPNFELKVNGENDMVAVERGQMVMACANPFGARAFLCLGRTGVAVFEARLMASDVDAVGRAEAMTLAIERGLFLAAPTAEAYMRGGRLGAPAGDLEVAGCVVRDFGIAY
jgi:hypothetical protein